MRPLVGAVPEPAERACSALRRCPRATLTLTGAPRVPLDGPPAGHFTESAATPARAQTRVPLVHHVPGTADLWVAVPVADAESITFPGRHARLEVLDEIIGGAAEGRVRRVVVVEGRVERPGVTSQRHAAVTISHDLPDSALLGVGTDLALVRLRAQQILLTDNDGVTGIEPDDLATSGPDPFADIEGHWLHHLNDPRCHVVSRIATRVCRCLPAQRPLLVGIDRAGVDLEIVDREGLPRRERVPFAEACSVVSELGTQLRLLAGGSRYPLDRAALRP